jgi:hypothetical protein
MPLAKINRTGSGIIKADPLVVTDANEHKTTKISHPHEVSLVDQTWTPLLNIIKHRAGASWQPLGYYNQRLTRDSEVQGVAASLDPTFQSYIKIVNPELKVSSPLSANFDNETKTTTYSGTATLMGFVPNIGDFFSADTGESVISLFRVTEVSQPSILRETVYEINYSLDTQDRQKFDDLEKKTVRVYHYVEDFLNYGTSPLVLPQDYQNLVSLHAALPKWIARYLKWFFSQEYTTLLVPDQPLETYDPFMVQFFKFITSGNRAPELQRLRTLNVDEDTNATADSIWTALINRDEEHLRYAFTQYCLISVASFADQAEYNSIRYSGLSWVVYPINNVKNIDKSNSAKYVVKINSGLLISSQKEVSNPPTSLAMWDPGLGEGCDPEDYSLDTYASSLEAARKRFTDTVDINLKAISANLTDVVTQIGKDSSYVFSEAFYQNAIGQSVIERLVRQYLRGQKVDHKAITAVLGTVDRWGMLERFYYLPILFLMIQNALKGA